MEPIEHREALLKMLKEAFKMSNAVYDPHEKGIFHELILYMDQGIEFTENGIKYHQRGE